MRCPVDENRVATKAVCGYQARRLWVCGPRRLRSSGHIVFGVWVAGSKVGAAREVMGLMAVGQTVESAESGGEKDDVDEDKSERVHVVERKMKARIAAHWRGSRKQEDIHLFWQYKMSIRKEIAILERWIHENTSTELSEQSPTP